MVHASHTSDRARPAGTISETTASLRRCSGHSFIVASGLAESRGGLVAASLAVVSAAGESRRCGADSAGAFATLSAAASEEWEAKRSSQSMSPVGPNANQMLQPKRWYAGLSCATALSSGHDDAVA